MTQNKIRTELKLINSDSNYWVLHTSIHKLQLIPGEMVRDKQFEIVLVLCQVFYKR